MDILKVYHNGYCPPIIREIAATETMQRLKKVSMDCGCDYTSFPIFVGRSPADRYSHSLGVALIVWHFTHDTVQSVAGLLHDIATPAFSHVVDFLNNDHLTQESTEEKTREMIASSAEIMAILNKYDIDIDDVYDYHRYSIADNDTPLLSADRLEYTLKNMVRYLDRDIKTIQKYYDDQEVTVNECGERELGFKHLQTAIRFSRDALDTCKIYSSDPDRYIMEFLAGILKKGEEKGILEVSDLYKDEPHVIEILEKDEETSVLWNRLKGFSEVHVSDVKEDRDYLKIPAKKRYIDPLIINKGRCSKMDRNFGKAVNEYLKSDFDYYVKAQ